MKAILNHLRGDGLRGRAMRGSAWTIAGYGISQVLRLATNLILTRLLFPEAFGLMALVTVFMQGLVMFSDVGIGPSIIHSKRGDDPNFLNSAWSIQIIRGFILWLASCVIAIPLANFYGEPQLAQLIPVAGLGLMIAGFNPTRLETAHRHLQLGRISIIQIVTQFIGAISAVILVLITHSVWAFVISGLISVFAQLVMYTKYLDGERNRFHWEKEAITELITFGKWIFLSTVSGFLFLQGDKIILGKFLTIDALGVYNIGYFLASFPMIISSTVIQRILMPLYRERPPSESAENYAKMRTMRVTVTAGILSVLMIFAFGGVTLINFMYDQRYSDAGAIVTLTACMQIPLVIILTYDQAALASGDSKRFFILSAAKAIVMLSALMVGVQMAGLFGALISQGIAIIIVYPVVIWLAKRQGAWDPLHDLAFGILGLLLGGAAIWYNIDAILALKALSF
jgi:O-antigen/teichoic acid export membrane protein